jgi:hypothetical protein
MRLSIFIICVVLFAACHKESSKVAESFTGTWELRKIYGEGPVLNYEAGNGNILKCTDSTYEIYKSDSLIKSGIYKIVEDTSVATNVCRGFEPGEYAHRIIYDNDDSMKQYFQITGNTLSIVFGCFAIDSGIFNDYEKIGASNDK